MPATASVTGTRPEINDVIGPDEFHEHVNNNAYTNVMAKWNLITAYRYYHDLKVKDKKIIEEKLFLSREIS